MNRNWDLTNPQHSVSYADTIEQQIDQANRRGSTTGASEPMRLWPRPVFDMFGQLDKRIKGVRDVVQRLR